MIDFKKSLNLSVFSIKWMANEPAPIPPAIKSSDQAKYLRHVEQNFDQGWPRIGASYVKVVHRRLLWEIVLMRSCRIQVEVPYSKYCYRARFGNSGLKVEMIHSALSRGVTCMFTRQPIKAPACPSPQRTFIFPL